MKAFFKELITRLARPTVYAPIIGFIITVMVSAKVIDLGDTSVDKIIELVIQIVGAILTIFGVSNNPTDKKNF
jgi:hypothetical protein